MHYSEILRTMAVRIRQQFACPSTARLDSLRHRQPVKIKVELAIGHEPLSSQKIVRIPTVESIERFLNILCGFISVRSSPHFSIGRIHEQRLMF